jgi:hypothetical protein
VIDEGGRTLKTFIARFNGCTGLLRLSGQYHETQVTGNRRKP